MKPSYHRSILLLLLVACGSGNSSKGTNPDPAPEAGAAEYRATIRWTSYGVPHIEAADLGSLAFGQGYAFARQNICVLADQIVKVRSERSRYFGPGDADANLTSDFGHLALGVVEQAEALLPKASDEMKAVTRGYAAGYNAFLKETGADSLPPNCARAAWVVPISEVDLTAYALSVGMIGSSGYFMASIAKASPPGDGGTLDKGTQQWRSVEPAALPASNGWAIGAERSATGRGMLVANPHFPWEGELRFYESHLTIPGDLNVYGANLLGLPLVSIGFNENLAWTHTFSSSRRFALYRLTLKEGEPTRYKYGEKWRDMTSKELAIQVRQDDGSLAEQKRTIYRSHYGPILSGVMLPWTGANAFAIRDVTSSETVFGQYLAMIRAKDLAEFQAAFEKYQATGFVNTIYADREGNAWYIDGSAVPDLTPAGLAAWRLGLRTIPRLEAAWDSGIIVLDGAIPMFELATNNQARPGAVPYARAPKLLRRDYVMNSNDSYWLTNTSALLTGFSPFYGEAERAPSRRTRMNHLLLAEVDKFTFARLKQQIISNRALTSELLREAVIERCRAGGKQLTTLCDTLAAWDGTFGVDAKGALLWRELMSSLEDNDWAEPFDKAEPIATPRGLAPAPARGKDPLVEQIESAVDRLAKADIPLDARLGDLQFTERGGKRFGMPGSNWREGSTNPAVWIDRSSSLLPSMDRGRVINPTTGLTDRGYPVNYGTSFLMAVTFEDDGPRAEAIVTYSGSGDPRSPHFSDQTALYSSGTPWRPVLFTPQQIQADPNLQEQQVTAPR